VRGGAPAAARFVDGLQLLSHSPNLGDSRTIVTHPASTTHSKLSEAERRRVGIVPGLVRISIGLEHAGDILRDITQSLEAAVALEPRAV
jgi:O-succinylhomoserine sulfhydrylase